MSKLNNKVVGDLGEQIAARYLVDNNYKLIMRNYWRKWGEIDIIAEKEGRVHFVEVKTVSYETTNSLQESVSRESWRPEEQVHKFKIKQIHKALETWIAESSYTGEWQIDVVGVRIVPRETYATVNLIANVA